jgi:SHAQKYF class myb-like DNA-binding protein
MSRQRSVKPPAPSGAALASAVAIAPRPYGHSSAPWLAGYNASPSSPGFLGVDPKSSHLSPTTATTHSVPLHARAVSASLSSPKRPDLSVESGRTATTAATGGSDIVFANGTTFNGRGYQVCGVKNKRGLLCGRIGTCPFHARKAAPHDGLAGGTVSLDGQKSAESAPSASGELPSSGVCNPGGSATRLSVAPAKGRFKRSWTKEEHSRFLVALEKHGRGKWKEIAHDVGTRNGSQCQSHACKYFNRQAKNKSDRKKQSIHDMTEPQPLDGVSAAQPLLHHSFSSRSSAALLHEDAKLLLPRVIPDHDDQFAPPSSENVRSPNANDERHDEADFGMGDSQIEVVVHLNNSSLSGRRVALPESMNREEFLAMAANELGVPMLTLSRVFTRNGVEVDTLDAVMDGEPLWLSDGADFCCVVSEAVSKIGDKSDPGVDAGGVGAEDDRVPVIVHLNGSAPGIDSGRSILLPESMEREDFLLEAADCFAVHVPLTRIFTRSGAEIESLDEVLENEELWLSHGDDFSCGT